MTKHRNFLIFLILFACTAAHAQLQKGTLFIREGIGSENIAGVNTGSLGNLSLYDGLTSYTLSPSLGYFLSKRFMLEGSLTLAGISADGDGLTVYGVGTGARFFLNPDNPKHNFFIEAQSNFIGLSIDGESSSQFIYGAGLGSTSFLAPGVSLDTRILFTGPLSDDGILSTSNTLSFNTGLSFYLNPTMKSERKTVTPVLQKGTWMIGGSNGSIDFSFDPSEFSFSLVPRIGYFVSDQFVVGANIGINFSRTEESLFGEVTTTDLSLLPAARYYFGKNPRLRWFAGASAGVNFTSFNSDFFGKGNDTIFTGALNGGFNFFLSPNFAFEAAPFLATDFDDVSGGLNLGFNYFIR